MNDACTYTGRCHQSEVVQSAPRGYIHRELQTYSMEGLPHLHIAQSHILSCGANTHARLHYTRYGTR